MWVTVTSVHDDQLEGGLDNDPDDIPGLEAGAPVSFFYWNIVAVQFAPEHGIPSSRDTRREYWERCFVDKAILEGRLKVGYLCREEPDASGPDEIYPDGGLRIRGDMRNQPDEAIGAREATYMALGAVLNRDNSWLYLIDEPVGNAFDRNFDDDTYVAIGDRG
jgi:hypothetical protein